MSQFPINGMSDVCMQNHASRTFVSPERAEQYLHISSAVLWRKVYILIYFHHKDAVYLAH